jgi:hypothetical protein
LEGLKIRTAELVNPDYRLLFGNLKGPAGAGPNWGSTLVSFEAALRFGGFSELVVPDDERTVRYSSYSYYERQAAWMEESGTA